MLFLFKFIIIGFFNTNLWSICFKFKMKMGLFFNFFLHYDAPGWMIIVVGVEIRHLIKVLRFSELSS
jgi:hypothetical protein